TLLRSLAPRRTDALPEGHLAVQLPSTPPCETGTVPSMVVTISESGEDGPPKMLRGLLMKLAQAGSMPASPARQELQRRLDREPLEVATQLARHYGHDLNQVAYIPALA